MLIIYDGVFENFGWGNFALASWPLLFLIGRWQMFLLYGLAAINIAAIGLLTYVPLVDHLLSVTATDDHVHVYSLGAGLMIVFSVLILFVSAILSGLARKTKQQFSRLVFSTMYVAIIVMNMPPTTFFIFFQSDEYQSFDRAMDVSSKAQHVTSVALLVAVSCMCFLVFTTVWPAIRPKMKE